MERIMLHRTILLSFLLTLFFAWPARIQAQPDDMPPGRGRQRIEELRRIKMIEALNLSEEQSLRLFAREKELQAAERTLMQARQASLDKLENLVRSGADADIMAEVERLGGIGRDLATRRQEYLTSLRDILSAQQIGKLLLFEDSFRKELRDIIREHRARQPR